MIGTTGSAYSADETNSIAHITLGFDSRREELRIATIQTNSSHSASLVTPPYTPTGTMESGRSVRTISASDTDTIINHIHMIHLKLPLPPSVNTAFAGKEIRYKSVAYKEWENIADKALRQQEQYTITGDHWLTATYVLHINLYTQK